MIPALAAIAIDALAPSSAATGAAAAAGATKSVDFSQVMSQVTSDAVQSLKSGEDAAVAGLQGKANVRQVVDSVMSAERTLQTTLAVRDKAVAAYQQISQMAI